MSFIGTKAIKSTEETSELTPGGLKIIKVTFEDDTVEHFSSLMHEKIVSEEACTVEQLRDKRIQPVVGMVLSLLREYGLKFGELGYLSALLNNSLEYNRNSALCALWGEWMTKPLSVDDVDLITMDRLLKAKSIPLNQEENVSNKDNN